MGLILSLIGFTIFCISFVFILFPEKHSISIYKASIINLYDNNFNSDTIPENTQNLPESMKNDISPVPNELPINPGSWEENPFDLEKHRKEKLQNHLFEKYTQ